MSLVADYPDSSQHVAIASQIAGTGVPLLGNPSLLDHLSASVIAAGSQYLSPVLAIGQISYDIVIEATCNAASTAPWLEIRFTWTDSASGLIINQRQYIMPSSGNIDPFTVTGYGPCLADELQIAIINLDSSNSQTITYAFVQHSRPYSSERWGWNYFASSLSVVPGFTLPTLPLDGSVTGVLNAITVSASSNKGYLFGMAPGQLVSLTGIASGVTPASVQVVVTAVPSNSYTPGAQLLNTVLTTASFNYQFPAPRAPMFVEFLNNATSGTLTVSGMMTAQAA